MEEGLQQISSQSWTVLIEWGEWCPLVQPCWTPIQCTQRAIFLLSFDWQHLLSQGESPPLLYQLPLILLTSGRSDEQYEPGSQSIVRRETYAEEVISIHDLRKLLHIHAFKAKVGAERRRPLTTYKIDWLELRGSYYLRNFVFPKSIKFKSPYSRFVLLQNPKPWNFQLDKNLHNW